MSTDNVIELGHTFELYIPTQCICGLDLDKKLRDETVLLAKGKFYDWFGGATVSPVNGIWRLPDGTIADENVEILESLAGDDAYEDYQDDAKKLAVAIADKLSQDRVLLKIDGRGFLFARSDQNVKCGHNDKVKTAEPKPVIDATLDTVSVYYSLSRFSTVRDARQLFCNILNYRVASSDLPWGSWPEPIRKHLKEMPEVIADTNGFRIVHLHLAAERLKRGAERQVIQRIYQDDPTFRGLFVVSDLSHNSWEFINVKNQVNNSRSLTLRRMRIGTPAVRTATERIIKLHISEAEERTITANEIQFRFDEAFDVTALTEQFYKEISNWYFWAKGEVNFPPGQECAERDVVQTTCVIRMITRLIFIWFLKEKRVDGLSLIPEGLFDKKTIAKILKGFDPDGSGAKQPSHYYKAIMQNLFFAVLNQPMKNRRWRKDGKGEDKNVYRYQSLFVNSSDALALFKDIPYLNGGLFDCLEQDQFSDIPDASLKVQDYLFFSLTREIDLNSSYGTRNKRYTVSGIIEILSRYNFTVEENTPLEEEIALDPELLGKVFENLLAEIDPDETVAKSAKKASGSFYTPRKIIDNMVNESLLLYLGNYFKARGRKDATSQLQKLIYADLIDGADEAFNIMVVAALSSIKVLDPACGSGAFPMGMLHRIVAILNIVDPNNHLWLEKQLAGIEDKMQRANFEKILARHLDDYSRKLGIIKDAIYGIDIQPLAVMITKLRFFISLLIEQNIDMKLPEENYHITPMPNLETKILCADSLKDVQPGLFDESLFTALLEAKGEYYQPNLSAKDKEKIADDIAGLISKMYPNFAPGRPNPDKQSQLQRNKKYIHEWFEHGNLCAPFFNQDIFFPELKHSGFDIVLGNPPYGGTDIPDEVKTALGLGSKDPYAAFIARFLGNGTNTTPLKPNGILAYIVSDTFMTIKSHKELRQQMMNNYIHKMIRVHPDTFKATVNTAIIICERNLFPANTPISKQTIDKGHHCQMVDMTTISIHDNYDRFMEVLHRTEGFVERGNISTPEYAIYFYPQSLIKTNSNLPFFIASPKLFSLMNDSSAEVSYIDRGSRRIQVRKININHKSLLLVKMELIADAKQGLKTGDNRSYLFKDPEARGTYKDVSEFEQYLLSEQDLLTIRNDQKLKQDIIDNGVSKASKTSKRYFNGRYIVPLDKGGESDSAEGWIPNYYVPTEYYIDWSEWAVKRMKSLTIKERDGKGENKICSRFQNVDYFFREGITFSPTGIYAPSFRINSCAVFESKGSTIFINHNAVTTLALLGLFASKLIKYQLKNYISHTVESGEAAILSVNIVINSTLEEHLGKYVSSIIAKQKKSLRYDYASNEQQKIDRLIYEAYGLNEDDITEVENWYARRYPRLNQA